MTIDDILGALPGSATVQASAMRHEVQADPEAIDRLFPRVGRRCGRIPLAALPGWSVDDAVRAVLLASLPIRGPGLSDVLTRLYRHGDAAERRAVVRALAIVQPGPAALPLVEDALRTNDSRLITAALGEYGAQHLTDGAFRQAVLKCVFGGIPLRHVTGLPDRIDAELVRMLTDYARERSAAGRPIPADVEEILRKAALCASSTRTST
jgi:hypothetical protein